jgi:hypothetical protein
MEDLLFTRDGRYVLAFNRIVDVETGLFTVTESPNPFFVCEMFKNQSLFLYKHSIIESTELFSKIRKSLYRLMESDTNMIMEYELKFGKNLILESSDSFLIEKSIVDSWDFVKNKLSKKYTILYEGFFGDLWDKTKNVAGKAWQGIKDAGAWVLNKGIPWIMTKIEEFMMSPVGIGLDVALTALGIGKLATGTIWGILLVWKIYKLVSGKSDASDVWTYIDMAVCLAGLVFSGAAKGLKAAFKAAGGNVAKVGGKVLQPILTVMSKGLGGIMNLMVKPLEWISKFLGPKASSMISGFKSRIGEVLKKMETIFKPKAVANLTTQTTKTGFKQGVKNYIKKDFTEPIRNIKNADLGKATRKGLSWGTGTYVASKGLEKGAKYFASNSEPSQEDLSKLAQSIPDETLKQGIESDMTDLLNKMN